MPSLSDSWLGLHLDFRGEDGGGQADLALEDAREALALERRRVAEVEGARDVRGAVLVLAARVAQVHLAVGDGPIRLRRRAVVHDGPVGT